MKRMNLVSPKVDAVQRLGMHRVIATQWKVAS